MLRTHTCGELRAAQVGTEVTLCGWVDSYRDHGGTVFIDLRDRYGKTQLVFDPDAGADLVQQGRALRGEDVVAVTGVIAPRPDGTVNPKLSTGEVELRVRSLNVLNKCQNPPFFPTQADLPNEDLRLRHRYLDLRRPQMQQTLVTRSRIIKLMRDYFDEHGFIDVETPILGRSTPEGARDYLVPSRVNLGNYFALPQSPQLYKQILMIAGYDRYIQVARCFRDEDLRADRQPEFTQLDLEMSFVQARDVMDMIDGLMKRLAKELLGIELQLPLPTMSYADAMRRFGHDAPDLRFGMEIVDCSDLARQAEFRVFKSVVEEGGFVRGINAQGAAEKYSRKDIDQLTTFVQENFGAKGLAWFKVDADGKLQSPIAKNFTDGLLAQFAERMQAKPGDFLLLSADEWTVTCRTLNGLRRRLGAELKLYEPGAMHFSWVVEFPMFDFDPEEKRWVAMHHPFTAPLPQDAELLGSDPSRARAQAYDLVINGSEAGGGTIRLHDSRLQQQVFELLGMDAESARARFGFLLDALRYGAPPHGGIALGIDRIVMLFTGLENIRECIAFPKTQKATDLMTGAPGPVELKQLRELGIRNVTSD
ncbi:MAG: aspartate--tRNA ligase [Pirellulales bacterium]